ncbi:MAG: hypothetical protein IPJ77_07280 [Planctomycetes bacterium]|nr:hypothetical protein [Planctomycetota bacterium]
MSDVNLRPFYGQLDPNHRIPAFLVTTPASADAGRALGFHTIAPPNGLEALDEID